MNIKIQKPYLGRTDGCSFSPSVFVVFYCENDIIIVFFFVLMGSISFWFKGLNTYDDFAQDQGVNVLCDKREK
jgi:hypothetical protein